MDGEVNLPIPTDTLVTLGKSDSTVVIKSNYSSEPMLLNKFEFDFDPIAWEGLESWKRKIRSEFKNRAELKECPDLIKDDGKIRIEMSIPDSILGEEKPVIPNPVNQ